MINKHPRGGKGVFQITLRPNIFNQQTFDEVIQRQGQLVRWMKSRPCPVRTDTSHHDMRCNICHGRGDIYEFQRKFWVYQEQSPHGTKHILSCAEDIVVPYKEPILEVGRLVRFLSEAQGGVTEFDVLELQNNVVPNRIKIGLKDPADCFPETWETLFVDYAIDLWDEAEKEFTSDGSSIINKFDLELQDKSKLLTNNLEVRPFITEVISAIDEDGNDLQVHSFFNQTVYIKNPPVSGKKYTIKVFTMEPIIMVIHQLSIKLSRELKWEMEIGDMVAVVAESYDIGNRDIVTAVANRNRREEVIVRGDLDFDTLPYFDIFDLDDKIYDADGKKYVKGVDYVLFDHDKVKWVGDQPAPGVNFSISMLELMTYRVLSQKPQLNANENKRLPKIMHLRKLDKMQKGPLQTGLKNEDRPVGDWSAKYG